MVDIDTPLIGSRPPLGVQVADSLREQISQQGLVEGDLLPSEAQLARQYGVSARVVRDALRSLHNQGVVETRQGKRATVSGLRPVAVKEYFKFVLEADAQSFDELLELRLLLEVPAARLAAERATADQIAEMRKLVADVERSGTDLDDRVPADIALHTAISRSSGNRFIHSILQSLSEALAAERRTGAEISQAHGSDHTDSTQLHAGLVTAIEQRDPDAAEAAARAIVTKARSGFAAKR